MKVTEQEKKAVGERPRCTQCNQLVPRRPVGRPRLTVDVLKVFDALAEGQSVAAIAARFKVSRASVYRIRAVGQEAGGAL